MAWAYECEVEWLDPRDKLIHQFGVDFASTNRLPPAFVVNTVTQRAYSIIQQFTRGSPLSVSRDDLDITVKECQEVEVP